MSVDSSPMSSSYAEGLSPYDNKGKLGVKEVFDSKREMLEKVSKLASWIKESKHVVFHTGAGISTSAGIPDFRGPQGVWTLEAKGLKPTVNISFNDAVPTKTHMALKMFVDKGIVKHVISQNIDGLHLRSGMTRSGVSELHGNMFVERCNQCERKFVRPSATTSVGEKCLQKNCPLLRPCGRACRGKLHDTILDWEASLPDKELTMAECHSGLADLSIALGTTLQILPSGNLPLLAKKHGGRVVICNLQPTKHDKKGDLLIHWYVDDIMQELASQLSLTIPEFDLTSDPTRLTNASLVEWTISLKLIQSTKKLYSETVKTLPKPPKKRKLKKTVKTEKDREAWESRDSGTNKHDAAQQICSVETSLCKYEHQAVGFTTKSEINEDLPEVECAE